MEKPLELQVLSSKPSLLLHPREKSYFRTRYVETENGIEEEAACFSGIYITAIVRRFHCGPL
jgi:hypothetical protein